MRHLIATKITSPRCESGLWKQQRGLCVHSLVHCRAPRAKLSAALAILVLQSMTRRKEL
jgi:hypothetical protein